MTQSLQYRRLLWLALLVVLAYCGLGWRLVEMQYLGADTARQQFAQTAVEEVIEVPMRGNILDRNGVVLTTSVRQYDIAADPSYIQPYGAGVAAALAGPLKMEVAELRRLGAQRLHLVELQAASQRVAAQRSRIESGARRGTDARAAPTRTRGGG